MAACRLMTLGVALSATLLGGAAIARAQEVGCCRAVCRWSHDEGRSVRAMTLSADECTTQFDGCDVVWVEEPCAEAPVGGGDQVLL